VNVALGGEGEVGCLLVVEEGKLLDVETETY